MGTVTSALAPLRPTTRKLDKPTVSRSALAKLKEAVPAAASRLSTALVDLASLPSVKRAAEELRGRVKELHILVNNAGVALPAGPQKTEAGLDIQVRMRPRRSLLARRR